MAVIVVMTMIAIGSVNMAMIVVMPVIAVWAMHMAVAVAGRNQRAKRQSAGAQQAGFNKAEFLAHGA